MTFNKGDRVTLLNSGRFESPNNNWYSDTAVLAGAAGQITSTVKSRKVSVRFDHLNFVVRVEVANLAPEDPNAPRPRRLGETPEGMISPDDPRLSWLWDDAAAMADRRNLCYEYDRFADALGVPGRPKDYTVTTKINGFEAKIVVKARSQKEANKMVLGEDAE